MNQILYINACVRPESRTLRLAQTVLNQLDGQVSQVDLGREGISPLDRAGLERRNRLIASGALSDPMFRYAAQFARADEIVIAAPYWDLAFPALLRIYLEHVTISGATFYYSPEGIPIGLCRARRMIYVTTAGGPIHQNLGFDYVKALANTFYGIPEALCFQAEGLDIQGADVAGILQRATQAIEDAGL